MRLGTRGRSWAARGVCVVGLLWCGAVAFYTALGIQFKCGADTSYCAETREKNGLYRGVLDDPGGRPRADTPFFVRFESRRDADPPDERFRTNARGEYCIVWAHERVIPFIHLGDDSEAGRPGAWQPLNGRPPRDCNRGQHDIPRDRADDTAGKGPERAIAPICLAAVVLLALALVPGWKPAGQVLIAAGFTLTAVATLLAVVTL